MEFERVIEAGKHVAKKAARPLLGSLLLLQMGASSVIAGTGECFDKESTLGLATICGDAEHPETGSYSLKIKESVLMDRLIHLNAFSVPGRKLRIGVMLGAPDRMPGLLPLVAGIQIGEGSVSGVKSSVESMMVLVSPGEQVDLPKTFSFRWNDWRISDLSFDGLRMDIPEQEETYPQPDLPYPL